MDRNQADRPGVAVLITGRPLLVRAWSQVCRGLDLQVAVPGSTDVGRKFAVAVVDLDTASGAERFETAARTPVVVLIGAQPPGFAGALPSSTRAVVTWRDSLAIVEEAIRLTLAGECFLSASASSTVLALCTRHVRTSSRPIARLTTREIDVMQAMIGGHTIGSTARTLRIAAKTVEAHRSRAFTKLGVRSQNEAMARLLGDPGLLL